MESYDKFVRKHCCKLSPAESLKSGFHTQGQFRDALYQYRNVSLQRDFGGVGMTTKSIGELAQRVLQPELEPIQTKSVSFPTNYTHRPQQLQTVVIPSGGEISERDGLLAQIQNLTLEKENVEQTLLELKRDAGSGASGSGSSEESERYNKLKELYDRDIKILNGRLAEFAGDEAREAERADEAVESAKKAEGERKALQERQVRDLPVGKVRTWINNNWDKGLKEKVRLVDDITKSKLTGTTEFIGKDLVKYLIEVVDIDPNILYGDIITFGNVVGGTEPAAGEDPVSRQLDMGGQEEEEVVETETVTETGTLQRQPSLTDPLTEEQQRMVEFSEEEEIPEMAQGYEFD